MLTPSFPTQRSSDRIAARRLDAARIDQPRNVLRARRLVGRMIGEGQDRDADVVDSENLPGLAEHRFAVRGDIGAPDREIGKLPIGRASWREGVCQYV